MNSIGMPGAVRRRPVATRARLRVPGSRIREVSDSADLRLRHPRGAQDGDGLRGFLGGWLFDATGGYKIAFCVAAPPVIRWLAPSRHCRSPTPLSVSLV